MDASRSCQGQRRARPGAIDREPDERRPGRDRLLVVARLPARREADDGVAVVDVVRAREPPPVLAEQHDDDEQQDAERESERDARSRAGSGRRPRAGHGGRRARRAGGQPCRIGGSRPGYPRRRRPRMDSRNEEKKTWMPMMTSAAASTARRSSDSSPKPRWIQVTTMPRDDHDAGEQRDAAEQQPVLEPEARAHAVEPRVLARP